jgi:hypothetical protein
VRNDQSGLVQSRYHVCHRKGLAGARHTQQSLKLVALPEAFYQLFDRLWLIAGGGVGAVKFENGLIFLFILHKHYLQE